MNKRITSSISFTEDDRKKAKYLVYKTDGCDNISSLVRKLIGAEYERLLKDEKDRQA